MRFIDAWQLERQRNKARGVADHGQEGGDLMLCLLGIALALISAVVVTALS